MPYMDDVATGNGQAKKLRIAGRPRQGREELYVLTEEPQEPVLMHWRGQLVPHFKRDCQNCGSDEPKPLWYVGGIACATNEQVIVELTRKCFESASAASRNLPSGLPSGMDLFGDEVSPPPTFMGLLIRVVRANFAASQRVLRCEQRVKVHEPWPHNTRLELARIWNVPMKPKLYVPKAEGA